MPSHCRVHTNKHPWKYCSTNHSSRMLLVFQLITAWKCISAAMSVFLFPSTNVCFTQLVKKKKKHFKAIETTYKLLIKHSEVIHSLTKQIPSEYFIDSGCWLSGAQSELSALLCIFFSSGAISTSLRHRKRNREEHGSPHKQLYSRGRENSFSYMCMNRDTTQFTQ